jgi:hypothetical protein
MVKIKIASEFSRTPGPRLIKEGSFSGELFRDNLLAPKIKEVISSESTLEVDLDGTAGYGTSFLEESFGGLVRVLGIPYEKIMKVLVLISNEEPSYIEEIMGYLKDAHEGEKS